MVRSLSSHHTAHFGGVNGPLDIFPVEGHVGGELVPRNLVLAGRLFDQAGRDGGGIVVEHQEGGGAAIRWCIGSGEHREHVAGVEGTPSGGYAGSCIVGQGACPARVPEIADTGFWVVNGVDLRFAGAAFCGTQDDGGCHFGDQNCGGDGAVAETGGIGRGGCDGVTAGGIEGHTAELTGGVECGGRGYRPHHIRVAGREGETLSDARLGGCRQEGQFRKDDDLQFTDTTAIGWIVLLQSGQERTLIADGEAANAFIAPHDAHLVAVFVDGLGADDGPVVDDIHPFWDGVDGGFAHADDGGPADGCFTGDDGDLNGGRLIADVWAVLDLQAHFTEGSLVPLQADFCRTLPSEGHVVSVGVRDGPLVIGSGTARRGPVARAVSFAECGDAFDVRSGQVEDLDVQGLGVLTATDGVALGIEQGGGHGQEDGVVAGSGVHMDGVDRTGKGAVSEIPAVLGTRGGLAGELDVGLQAHGGGSCEGGCGRGPNVHAFLKCLTARGAGDGDQNLAVSGRTPFHFHSGGVAEGAGQQCATLDGPCVGGHGIKGGLHHGDRAAADVHTVGVYVANVPISIRVGIVVGIEFDEGAVCFRFSAFDGDLTGSNAEGLPVGHGVGELEGAATGGVRIGALGVLNDANAERKQVGVQLQARRQALGPEKRQVLGVVVVRRGQREVREVVKLDGDDVRLQLEEIGIAVLRKEQQGRKGQGQSPSAEMVLHLEGNSLQTNALLPSML